MEHKDVWNFKYRGIPCEVVHWYFESTGGLSDFANGNWNSYMYLNEGNLPKSFKSLLPRAKVSDLPSGRKFWQSWKMESLFEMHGGVSLYEVKRDEFTGRKTGLKIGCDYSHYFDLGHIYNEEFVASELRASVDKVFERFPEILIWRRSDGKFVSPDEVKKEE